MIRYRVDWHPEFGELFQSFRENLTPQERRELTTDVNTLEHVLSSQPKSGIPLRDGGWIFQVNCFRFFYELDEADRRVMLRSLVKVKAVSKT